jgi:DNA-binding phage protein
MGIHLWDSMHMNKMQPSKKFASDNLTKLMAKKAELDTLDKVAAKSGLGRGTIDRMKKAQTAITLDTLDDVAKAFKLHPWQLIQPDLGMYVIVANQQEQELLAEFRAMSANAKNALLMSAKSLERDKAQEVSLRDDALPIRKK